MDFGPLKLDIQKMAGLRPQKWTLADNYHGDKIALSLAHQYINISVETLEQGTTWTRSQIYLVHLNFSYLYITSTLQEISGLANRILTVAWE